MTMKELLFSTRVKYTLLGIGLIASLPILLKINHDRKVLKVLRRIDKKL